MSPYLPALQPPGLGATKDCKNCPLIILCDGSTVSSCLAATRHGAGGAAWSRAQGRQSWQGTLAGDRGLGE